MNDAKQVLGLVAMFAGLAALISIEQHGTSLIVYAICSNFGVIFLFWGLKE